MPLSIQTTFTKLVAGQAVTLDDLNALLSSLVITLQGGVDASEIADNALPGTKIENASLNLATKGILKSLTYAVVADGGLRAENLKADPYLFAAATLNTGVYGFALSPADCNPSAYEEGQIFFLKADAGNEGAVDVNCNSLGARDLKKSGGVELAAGDIIADQLLLIQYHGDAATGHFQLLSPVANRPAAILGGSRNLIIRNDTSNPDTILVIQADEVVLKDAAGNAVVVSSVSKNVDITDAGAGGLDTGTEGGSRFYYVWLIGQATAGSVSVEGLLSTSSSAPTLPSGYTYKALLGCVYNDSSSNFRKIHQHDRTVTFENQQVWSGEAAAGADTWANYSSGLGAILPPIARSWGGVIGRTDTTTDESYIQFAANTISSTMAGGAITICVPRSPSGVAADAANGNFSGAAVPFQGVPIAVSQQFAWKAGLTTATWKLMMNQFTI